MKRAMVVCVGVLVSVCGAAIGEVERWDAAVRIGARTINVVIELDRDAKQGTAAIPVQEITATAVTGMKIEQDTVSFVLPLDRMPPEAHPLFELTVPRGEGVAKGKMRQGSVDLDVTLRKLNAGEAGGPPRPQHPVGKSDYEVREVVVNNAQSGGNLAGTLTLPESSKFGAGPHPAVVLLTGSGPQDRDETIAGHKPFWVLADDLTKRGVAVLRMDDRGVGGSDSPRGALETTDDFVTDALAGIAYLRTLKEINAERVGLIGHSEGGVVAAMAAARSKDVAFIAMLAGTGVPGRSVMVEQMNAIVSGQNADGEAKEKVLAAHRKLIEVASAHLEGETLAAAIEELVVAQVGGPDPVLINETRKQMTSAWMRRFMVLDPVQSIRLVRCPVLAISGSKDLQVLSWQNVPAVVNALVDGGSSDYTVRVLPGLNHLFQPSASGSLEEYAWIETTFAPEALEVVGAWVVEKGKVKK